MWKAQRWSRNMLVRECLLNWNFSVHTGSKKKCAQALQLIGSTHSLVQHTGYFEIKERMKKKENM